MRREKRKKREGEKAKKKSRLLCHFKTQLNLEILLSAHAQTSQGDQKAKSEGRFCGKF